MSYSILTNKADKTYSVEDFISSRITDKNTYYNFSIHEYNKGCEFGITNILYDYMDELEENSIIVKLNQEELIKYKYKPWLLAFDLYGSEQSVFLIKILNGILHDNEFDLERVKIVHPSIIGSILGRIYTSNTRLLNNNKSNINKSIEQDDIGCNIW